jgi:hypothetical protein
VPSKDRERGRPDEQVSPSRFAETTPPIMPSGDYSYTVEIVMNMQHSLGKLTEAVDGLKTRQAEQGAKLDSLDKKVYAAIVLILVFGAILSFFAKSINDAITERVIAPVFQQQPHSAPPLEQPTTEPNQKPAKKAG